MGYDLKGSRGKWGIRSWRFVRFCQLTGLRIIH